MGHVTYIERSWEKDLGVRPSDRYGLNELSKGQELVSRHNCVVNVLQIEKASRLMTRLFRNHTSTLFLYVKHKAIRVLYNTFARTYLYAHVKIKKNTL